MNKTLMIVIGVVIVAGAGYWYSTMNSMDADMKTADTSTFIKSDTVADNGTSTTDISNSVDNVNMAELNAQISADMKDIDTAK
jgi:hypothetical protein